MKERVRRGKGTRDEREDTGSGMQLVPSNAARVVPGQEMRLTTR